MMGRVSRPAQIVAVLVLGIGGAIYYVQREAAGVPSRAGTPNVESEFRALHEATSDEDLRKEQSRLHEAIAREVAVVADEYVVRGEHVPSHADACTTSTVGSPASWTRALLRRSDWRSSEHPDKGRAFRTMPGFDRPPLGATADSVRSAITTDPMRTPQPVPWAEEGHSAPRRPIASLPV